jgi:hypothetical protein
MKNEDSEEIVASSASRKIVDIDAAVKDVMKAVSATYIVEKVLVPVPGPEPPLPITVIGAPAAANTS